MRLNRQATKHKSMWETVDGDLDETIDLINMSSQLGEDDAFQRVLLAHQDLNCDKNDPNYNETDGKIYKRIVLSDHSSEEEQDDMTDPMRELENPLAAMENMDSFI